MTTDVVNDVAVMIDAAVEPVENVTVTVGTMDTLKGPSCSTNKFIGCGELQSDIIV